MNEPVGRRIGVIGIPGGWSSELLADEPAKLVELLTEVAGRAKQPERVAALRLEAAAMKAGLRLARWSTTS